MTRITIIETGTLSEEMEAKLGDYPSMFEKLLAGEDLETSTCRLVRGETLPAPEKADGYLITGSRHGVYDNLPWIEPLKAFIRGCAAKHIPIVGICFGHQIMAEALGGKVIKSPKGWGLGPNSYTLKDAKNRFADAPETMMVNAIHQDQIVEQPPNSEIIASSDFCEYAGLVYGGDKPYALSLQPHPEFDDNTVDALIRSRYGEVYPEDVADQALEKLGTKLDSQKWAKWIADFFNSALS